ncbi:MAG TPA: hypothetical protein VI260_04570, partial [Blastocatellia bacterium]
MGNGEWGQGTCFLIPTSHSIFPTPFLFSIYMTGGAKIWISRGIDWIGTASGADLSLRQRPLATARGTD